MRGFDIACDLVPDMEFFETAPAFKDAIRGLNITTKENGECGSSKITKQPAKSIILNDIVRARSVRVFKGHSAH